MSSTPRRRWPNCPECLTTLMDPLCHAGVTVDRCRTCAGIWLMGGQLQRILKKGDGARTAEWPARCAAARPRAAFNVFGASIGAAGIGWFAHLGGFAAGLAIALLAYRRVVAANPVLGYLNEGASAAREELRRPWRFRRRRRRVPPVARRGPSPN